MLAIGICVSGLPSCKCGKSVQSGISDIADCPLTKSQPAKECPENALFECVKQAFYKIPDHAKVSEDAKPFMTKELYEALSAAWDVPCWCDGEIGEEEFLYYFVTGNGGSTVGEVVYIEVISVQDRKQIIELKYTELWDGTPGDELKTISLVMVEDNGKWLLDDFGNGIKEQCRQYIKKEVDDFLSGKTTQYMRENQQGEWYSNEHIAKVEQEFKLYIKTYKDYILNIQN